MNNLRKRNANELHSNALWGRSELRSLVIKLNRRDPILVEQPGVDTAASFQIRDDLAELPWMDLQRLAEVSAYKPAASDR